MTDKRKVRIEQIKGGYILTNMTLFDEREAITTTEELFKRLLQIFEGRFDMLHGRQKQLFGHKDFYGKVTISREEPFSAAP